jgi:hypothetical protein
MELFQRAYEGGAEGAAVSYLMALQSPLEKQKADPALVAKLQADIRSAAAVGDPLALQHLSQATGEGARELGVTPGQAAGYKAAWTTIMEERFPGKGDRALHEAGFRARLERRRTSRGQCAGAEDR